MAEESRSRPYAATANVIAVLSRVRSRNLPEVINNELLRLAGVPEAVLGRVVTTLRFLDLIHEDGRPTEKLRAMAGATDIEYRSLLAGTVRDAYREDFLSIDPAQDQQHVIIDAFRRYEPRSQTSRMVMLFLGLCREASIPVLDAPRERQMQAARGRAVKPRGKVEPRTPRGRLVAEIPVASAPPVERTPDTALLFGVSEEDIGLLDEQDFNQVWTALGKVARARARARAAAQRPVAPDEEDEEDDAVGVSA